ncbi:hypothetical protein XA68_13401 [Ophiocordyceps unilateralis]|uniref:DUF1770 domain-containing protein n=1 Tax=Ophiocordyceps unilateralis TaxID=268505 RepID=A0A2A9PAV2_OPHUN|nr:hypothetical protein XA68_13401 [Ophiocordyceps unilateralis]
MSSLHGELIVGELAATVQAGHIRADPDPRLDIAPSTAAEKKQVLSVESRDRACKTNDDIDGNDEEDDIPCSVLRPTPRRRNLPPLPDLRFEQSYLHSISNADTWWKVMLITVRDQMVMPLAQGLIYNLLLNGWQYSRRNARFHGTSSGARLRRWWYGVNNWSIPSSK